MQSMIPPPMTNAMIAPSGPACVSQPPGASRRAAACTQAVSGSAACIATARAAEGGVRVSRLTAAVDIGRIVNIELARQQVEGGLIFGLSLAVGATTGYFDGLPTGQRLGDLALPRLADCPEIAVEFIASDAEPFDPGELGVTVAAPAIANALFSATGLRFRRLPLLSEGL